MIIQIPNELKNPALTIRTQSANMHYVKSVIFIIIIIIFIWPIIFLLFRVKMLGPSDLRVFNQAENRQKKPSERSDMTIHAWFNRITILRNMLVANKFKSLLCQGLPESPPTCNRPMPMWIKCFNAMVFPHLQLPLHYACLHGRSNRRLRVNLVHELALIW